MVGSTWQAMEGCTARRNSRVDMPTNYWLSSRMDGGWGGWGGGEDFVCFWWWEGWVFVCVWWWWDGCFFVFGGEEIFCLKVDGWLLVWKLVFVFLMCL